MSKAPAPTRGDKVTIAFGLVNVPVVLMNGQDENAAKIKRSRFSPAGNAISMKNMDSVTGELVEFGDLALKYETSDGTLVDLNDDEVAAAMGAANGDSELVGVFPNAERDRFWSAGPLQVRPQTTKVGNKTTRPYDKAFALFLGALADTDQFAVVRYVTRGKPKLAAIYPTGHAEHVLWANEVRDEAPMPVVEVSEDERALAKKLVQALSKPEFEVPENEAVEAVRTYAEAKAAGMAPADVPAAKPATADDVLALLSASVA